MPTFKFADKTTLDFEEFPIKDENIRKVNIVRDGNESEGVWAAFADADLKKYTDNQLQSKDYEAVVILVNSPLHFLPMNGWGAYIPVKFKGYTRPTMDMADMEGDIVWCKERLKVNAEAEAKQAKEAEQAKEPKAVTKAKTRHAKKTKQVKKKVKV